MNHLLEELVIEWQNKKRNTRSKAVAQRRFVETGLTGAPAGFTQSHCPPPPSVSILSLPPFVLPFLNERAGVCPCVYICMCYQQTISPQRTCTFYHVLTEDHIPNLPLRCEPLWFNLCVESRSSKIDVYEMKAKCRNDWADKSPTGADLVIEQKSQERFTVDVCSYFNNALSLTADCPAAFGRSLRLYWAGVNVSNMWFWTCQLI